MHDMQKNKMTWKHDAPSGPHFELDCGCIWKLCTNNGGWNSVNLPVMYDADTMAVEEMHDVLARESDAEDDKEVGGVDLPESLAREGVRAQDGKL